MTSGSSQGLFVIVAVVIFGIFVAISYLLFRDKMQIGLANIFGDSITQSKTDLSGKDGTNNDTEKDTNTDTNNEDTLLNVSSTREDSDYLYAKIREADASKNETEIWVQAKKISDGTLQLYGSSTSDSNYTSGTTDMSGSLRIPDMINGIIIKNIRSSFQNAKFTGELKLPSSLNTIENYSFHYSKFTGELKLPSSLIVIGDSSFHSSEFTGELKLPEGLTHIGVSVFTNSKFSGELRLPDTLTTIGNYSFYQSIFTGELKLPSSLIEIGANSFSESTFTGELKLPSSLKKINSSSFKNSTFTGTLDVSNVKYIQKYVFYNSRFNKVVRGDVQMVDDTDAFNTYGIHPQTIRLANGEFYTGSNDN